MKRIRNLKQPIENSKTKDLIKNTFIIFLGKASPQIISLLLLPLYTSYIITSEYGYVDLITTYVSLIVIIIALGLDLASFRFLIDYRKCEEKQKKVISNIFLCLLLIFVTFSIIFCVANSVLQIKYGWLVLVLIISNIISNILAQISRGLGNNLEYATSYIIGGIVTIILNIVLIVKFGLGGKALLLSTIISNFFISIYLIFKLKIYKMINFIYKDKQTIKELIKYSAPLIPNQISWWIMNVSDRTIISAILGVSENGIYSIANKIPNIFSGLYSVFHMSWTEQATIHYNDDDRNSYFSIVVNNGIKIFGSICLLLITIIPIVFNFFINDNYSRAYYQIPILLMAVMVNIVMMLFGVVYIARKMSNELAKTSALSAIINILVNVLLIKHFGLYAASISTFVACFLVMIYRWVGIKKYISIDLDKKLICILSLSFLISIYFYYKKTMNLVIFVLSFILTVYINKTNLLKIKKSIKNLFNKIIKGR